MPPATQAGPSRRPAGIPGRAHSSVGGKGKGGYGAGFARIRRRKILRDSIQGITKNDLRRLARRGGVKRMSAPVYDEMRACIKDYLSKILNDCVIYLEHANRRTVTVSDVIFALKRIGKPVWGFDPVPASFNRPRRR